MESYNEICKEQSNWRATRVKQINTWLEQTPKKKKKKIIRVQFVSACPQVYLITQNDKLRAIGFNE